MEPLTFILLLAGLVGTPTTAAVNTTGNMTSPTGSMTLPPVNMTPPPLNMTKPPLNMTPPPVNMTPPPLNMTPPPLNMTPPPLNMTPPPLNMTPPPLNGTSQPLNMTSPPTLISAMSSPATANHTTGPTSAPNSNANNATAGTTAAPSMASNTTAASTISTTSTTTASTDPPAANEGTLGLSFSLNQTFTEDLSNRSSMTFQTLARRVVTEVNTACRRSFPSTFLRSILNSFRSGSVIANMTLVFQDMNSVPSADNATSQLIAQINSTSLNIIAGTLAAMSSSTASTAAPNVTSTPMTASNNTANATVASTVASNATAGTTAAPSMASNTTAASTISATTSTTTASTDPPTASEGTLGLSFSLNQTFTEDLSNRSSMAFQTLARRVVTEVNTACRRSFPSTFLRSILNSFRSGSVIANMTLVFQDMNSVPSADNATSQLIAQINSTSLNIIAGTLAAMSSSTASTAAPNVTSTPMTASNNTANATVASTVASNATAGTTAAPSMASNTTAASTISATTSTTTASTDPPTASEGTLGLSFSLNQTFTEDLSNRSSMAFQTLARRVVTEVNRLARGFFTTFLRSIVNSFQNGSVVVNMTLVFQDQNSVPSTINATAAFAALFSGNSTTLDVIPGTISIQSTSTSTSSSPSRSTMGIWALTLLAVAPILIYS